MRSVGARDESGSGHRRTKLAGVRGPAVEGPYRPRTQRAPRVVAALVAIAGLVTLASTATSPLRGRVEIFTDVVPLVVRAGASSIAALAGLGTLIIAGGLARRQRRAWGLGLFLLVVAGISHLVKDLDVPQAGLNLGLAAVLVLTRGEFDAKPGPGSIRRAFVALPFLAGVVWAFGWIAILAHVGDIRPHVSVGRAALVALRGTLGFPLGVRVVGTTGRWIPGLLPLLGVLVLVVAFAMTLRPVVEGLRRSPADAARVAELVRRYGDDTLSYFALREDKSYFFWGRAVVPYRYLWNLGLVSGDPVGAPEDVPGAIEAFARHARERGWGLAVLAASERWDEVYRQVGLRSFYLGEEAILDPRAFSLDGRKIRKVRQSAHRLERAGYRVEFLSDGDVNPDLREALDAVTRSWRGRAPERGFTMALGRLPSPKDRDAMTVVVRDPNGRAAGYLHLVPCYGADPGYSVDQMRWRPTSPNGLTEWMVAETALELGRRGFARFSLNFAFLGRLFGSDVEISPWQRIEVAVVRRLNPFFQIESLHAFNAKFSPGWAPRFIYFEAPLSLPRVALAYLEAEAFLRLPLIGSRGRLLRRKTAVPSSVG